MFEERSIQEIMRERKVSTEVFEIIQSLKKIGLVFDLNEGPWVAGGSLTKAMLNEPLGDSDIDIFFPNTKTYGLFVDLIRRNKSRVELLANTFASETFMIKGIPTKIQFVKFKHKYSNRYKLLSHFDFNIVKAMTDGERMLYHKRFFKDLDARVLALEHYPINLTDNDLTIRTVKYILRGFQVDTATAMKIIAHNSKAIKSESLYR